MVRCCFLLFISRRYFISVFNNVFFPGTDTSMHKIFANGRIHSQGSELVRAAKEKQSHSRARHPNLTEGSVLAALEKLTDATLPLVRYHYENFPFRSNNSPLPGKVDFRLARTSRTFQRYLFFLTYNGSS